MLINLRKWFASFKHNYEHHHAVQDKHLFPLLAKKVADAAKIHSPDEVPTKKLLALFAAVEAEMKALSTQKPFHMHATRQALLALEEASLKHWTAMEAVPLALLRQHYKREEVKWNLEKAIVDDGNPQDAGWLAARCFDTDAERNEWLHKVPEISGERRKAVALPAAHKYLQDTQRLINEVINGKHHQSATAGTKDPVGGCCVIA